MPATIKIKNSSTASAVPTSSDLVQGELAVNVTDKRLFTENASGTVVELGTNPSILTLPDGSASAPTLTNDGDTNTGIFFPAADTVGITTGGTERARVDSSGNLGLGVTPSAWGSGWRALQFGGGGSAFTNGTTDARIGANTYYTGSTFAAISTGAASRYEQVAGVHYWLNAASVSAGTSQTFTQAMTLDASGNLGIGTTSPTSKLDVVTTSAGGLNSRIYNSATSGNSYAQLQLQTDAGNFYIFKQNSTNSTNAGAGSMGLYGDGAYPMAFYTNSTERARIDSSGNLLVAVTSTTVPGYGNTTTGTVINASNPACFSQAKADFVMVVNQNTIDGSNYDLITFRTGGSQRGTILSNGTTVSYNTSSDYRLKENVQPMVGALAKVSALKPCTYTWKETGQDSQGFIAHELAEVVPEAVSGEKDAVNEDGSIKPQGIDTSFLVATLTAAIQELKAEFDAYKASHP